ncbi:hypothetical protein BC629DRAFT_1592997 [Irpex lacteus]|nr:hypothetical protein BC629DRAFT_1592997 [Irpex lacteus]
MRITIPDRYPVTVPADSPVLCGLTASEKYNNAERSPQLPFIYEHLGPHPSHRVKFPESRTFVYLVDPSPEGKAVADALWMAQKVPRGSAKHLRGQLDMQPGDALLARPINRGGDPQHDCLQALCGALLERECTDRMKLLLQGSVYDHAYVVRCLQEFHEAREDMLGRRNDRTANDGKAAFEMDPRAQPVSDGPRCYPFNSMVQRQRQVEGPPATLKTIDNSPDEQQRRVHRYSLAATALNVLAWELQAPLPLLKTMREYGDHLNTPRLGHHRNFYWFSQQNNVASAQHPSEEHKFSDDQGFFSGVHKDKGDAGNGHSVGLSGSDLPDYAEPGRFHLVGQGAYFTLSYLTQVFFTGLLPHGGTAPLIPEHIPIEGWETRMFHISYPASSIISGEARHPFASWPYEAFPLYIPPEITGAFHLPRALAFWTNHATYAQDGWVCMDRRGLMNYLVRSMIQLLYWILRQAPSEYMVEIDCDVLTSAVTYMQDGERVPVDRWEFAPNPDVQQPFGPSHKDVQDAFLKTQYDHFMQAIPCIVENKYRDWDVTKIEFGGRPKAKGGTKRPIAVVTNEDSAGDTSNPADPQDKPLPKRSRMCTVAANSVREAAANAFPMVASTLPTFRPRNKVAADADVSRTPDLLPSDRTDVTTTDLVTSLPAHRSSDSSQNVSTPSGSLLPSPHHTAVTVSDTLNKQCLDFVGTLTADAILAASRDIKRVVVGSSSGESLRTALETLNELPSGLGLSLGNTYMSSDELLLCSKSLLELKNHCHATNQWLNLYRQQVMVFESHMVVSIIHLVDERCPFILQNLSSFAENPDSCDWLVRLTTKVSSLILCGLEVTADSRDFFDPGQLKPKKFKDVAASVRRRKNLRASKVESTVLSYLRRILCLWFGSDKPFTAQARTAFVGYLVHRLGEASLLLPLVWQTYLDVPAWLFSSECPRLKNADTSFDSRFEIRFLDPLAAALNSLSQSRLDSTVTSLNQLEHQYEALHTKTKQHVDKLLTSRTRTSTLKRLLVSLTAPVAHLSTSKSSQEDSFCSLLVPGLTSAAVRTTMVIAFLEDSAMALAALQGTIEEADLSDVQRMIYEKADHHMPLREDAPSRSLMRRLFNTDTAKTRSSFYSLQIFRFIHFNSGAFIDCPDDLRVVNFDSDEEFKLYMADLRARFPDEQESFFCNKKSIGHCINDRTTSRSTDYWAVAQSPSLKWPPARCFASAWEEVKALKKKLDESSESHWRGVGHLSAYLLLVDMHYAGLVDAPLPIDVARIVSLVRKGGMYGLGALGYITDRSSKKTVEEKFVQYYNEVDAALTEDQRRRFRWDPVVAEHTLCKFYRARREGYYNRM